MGHQHNQQRPNRLIDETSPYLLQHAYNPVDWYPWGAEALRRAREEDKPILLSIGYSACHWCHVMAHESFEDPETASLMNRLYVNVKVDREERPDLDAIYMDAVQAMSGGGGWPMTVFLTPDGKPFYGGTYFPSEARGGLPSFRQVLEAVSEAWESRRGELERAGDRVAQVLERGANVGPSRTGVNSEVLSRASTALLRSFDRTEGGFGRAPKFPQPMNLDFLLQTYYRTRDQAVLNAVTLTLTKMANGGMYDQLGGGFHRYSTDSQWLVPHFEKMLYDNAQLARTYLHAYQLTGEVKYRMVVEETLDYVLREMTSEEGGFYSTLDADSEGQEGKFYVWTADEIAGLLGAEEARIFNGYYGVTPTGNFHEGGAGKSILHIPRDIRTVAEDLEMSLSQLSDVLSRGRRTLLEARGQRVRPGRDEKVLAEWNGLMLAAFAEAGAALDRPDYLDAAIRSARFLLERMAARDADGALRLKRTYKDGKARLNGYLEDHGAVALGLLALYEATFESRWLEGAADLAHTIEHLFADEVSPGFFQTSRDHEQLVTRRKDYIDNAIPSGNSLAAELYLRLGKFFELEEYAARAGAILGRMADTMGEQPAAFGRLLCALDMYLNPGFEIAIVGDLNAIDTRLLLQGVWQRYVPNSVLAGRDPDDDQAARLVPFLAGRGLIDGRSTAYVCRNYVCNLPVTSAPALEAQLLPVPTRPED